MKPLKRKFASSLALLVFLSATQLASAFYDPSLGRWLNRDPIREPGFENVCRSRLPNVSGDGPNQYWFVRNQPVSGWDSFGLKRDCSGEQIQCFRNCYKNTCPFEDSDSTAGQNKAARYRYCQDLCQKAYMQCEKENEREEMEDDRNKSFCAKHPSACVIIGGILIILEEIAPWLPILAL